jgi:hypothetical protein
MWARLSSGLIFAYSYRKKVKKGKDAGVGADPILNVGVENDPMNVNV